MLHRAATALLLAFAGLLASCGGGGGGDSAPPYQLSFSPGTLATTYAQGSSQTVSVTATLDRTVSQTVNVAIVDSAGVIEPTVQLTALTPTSYQATLTTKSTLSVGEHVGSLKVHLCYDNPGICSSPLPGSPFSLPYTFTVTAPVVLPPAQVSPASITVDTYQDEVPTLQLSASLTTIGGTVYPQIVDPAGVFQPNPPTNVSGSYVTSTLFLSTSLQAGSHSGNLEFRVCADLACNQQVAGSPVLVPYNLVLKAATNLSPLSRAAGAGEWAQHQANAAHTGYSPMTLDASKFNRRWRWTPPTTGGYAAGNIQPVVTSSGSVYAVTSGYFQSASVYALSEHDKSTLWMRDFGSIYAANPPSTDAGMLYLATSGHSDTYMWGFDGTSGALNFRTAFGSQWEHYLAPAIANGAVYTNGGSYGGLLSFKIADGTQNWFTSLSQYDQWTPAVDGQYAYAFMPTGLNVIDVNTGVTAFVLTDPNNAVQAYSIFGAPMAIGASNVVVINGPGSGGTVNRLLNFDIAGRTLKWSIPGSFSQAPAFAKGVIYAVNGAQLEARSDTDGSRLWSWFPDEASVDPFANGYGLIGRNIIVTDNLIFVSSSTKVYALDLGIHKTVWTFPKPGQLALSPNGVLYITTPATADLPVSLYAINLN